MSGSRGGGGVGGPDTLGINKDNRVFSDQLVAIRPWVSSVHQSDHDHTKHMCTENPCSDSVAVFYYPAERVSVALSRT